VGFSQWRDPNPDVSVPRRITIRGLLACYPVGDAARREGIIMRATDSARCPASVRASSYDSL